MSKPQLRFTPEERARQFHTREEAEPFSIRLMEKLVYLVVSVVVLMTLYAVFLDPEPDIVFDDAEYRELYQNPFTPPYDSGEDSMSNYDYQDPRGERGRH